MRRHPWLATMCAALGLLLGFGAWAGVEAVTVRSELLTARAHALEVRNSLLAEGASRDLVSINIIDAQHAADRAVSAAGSPPLRILAATPWVGRPFVAAATTADAVKTVTDEVLPSAARAVNALRPEFIRDADGRLDIGELAESRISLHSASKGADAALRRMKSVRTTDVAAIDTATAQLTEQITELGTVLKNAAAIADVVPSMLGGDRPRTYLVVFQNNAEARGTGGLVGGFLVVRADRGQVVVTRTVADIPFRERSGLDLGRDFDQLYGDFEASGLWQNSNLSPHFPYAAQIWRHLWQLQTGQTVDGVIAVDPVALGRLLRAVGDIRLSNGQMITPDNVVATTESDAYNTFSGRKLDRKAYLAGIAEQVFRRLAGGVGDARQVVLALADSVGAHRIGVWSADTGEQATLASTSVGRLVPYSPAPYAAVVVNNASGSKLDYYLARKIVYRAGTCTNSRRPSEVSVTLTNSAPTAGLSDYVLGADAPGPRLPDGENRVTVSLYASWGARLESATIGGRPAGIARGTELGHPVFVVIASLPPGEPVTVVFRLTEPTAPGPADVPDQPLVAPADITTEVPQCSAA